MSFTFRPAIRENIGLFIGLAGASGSGKTWSAMAIASGIVGPAGRFAVIDTENKRACHYADDFSFDVVDLSAPYNSHRYEETVVAAHRAGYGAIVVDSATHEHEGEGGYLDAHDEILDEMIKRKMARDPNADTYQNREKLSPSAWMKPKQERKRMIQTMLACSSTTPIIFCFRAEEKVFKSVDGKLVAMNPPVWTPLCGKIIPFEMTVFFMLNADRPGYIHSVLKKQERLMKLFPLDKPLNAESGRWIAEWSKGAKKEPVPLSPPSTSPPPSESTAPLPHTLPLADRSCADLVRYIGNLRDGIGHERATEIIIGNFGGPVSSFKTDKAKLLQCIEKMEAS